MEFAEEWKKYWHVEKQQEIDGIMEQQNKLIADGFTPYHYNGIVNLKDYSPFTMKQYEAAAFAKRTAEYQGEWSALIKISKEQDKSSGNDKRMKKLMNATSRLWSVYAGDIENAYRLSSRLTDLVINGYTMTDLKRHMDKGDYEIMQKGDITDPQQVGQILEDQMTVIKEIFESIYVDTNEGDKKLIIDQSLILHVHGVLLRHCRWQKNGYSWSILPCGEYKIFPNTLKDSDGKVHFYCDPKLVSREMEALCKAIKEMEEESINPIVIAAWSHMEFLKIHPFADGNGRVGRLIASTILMKYDLPPFVITHDTKDEYFKACKAAEGDKPALESLVNQIERSLSVTSRRLLSAFLRV